MLDVGSGNGEFLIKLKKIFKSKIYGIDFSDVACQNMEKKNIKAFKGLFLDYLPDRKFDMISMNNYIEHVIDPIKELEKAYNILENKGKLIGVTDNYDSFDRRIFKRYWAGNHAPRHTYLFSPNVLREMLEKVGFKNVQIKQDINPGQIVISLQNFMQRKVSDLANNKKLIFGRTKYYSFYLLLASINLIFFLFSSFEI